VPAAAAGPTRVHTLRALEELGEILTELSWWSESGDSDDGDDPTGYLPVRIVSFRQKPDTVAAFLAAVGDDASVVCWDFTSWPAATGDRS